jgi:hypothetical protein
MPHYLFHLSDEENTYFDDTGKQLEDSRAAHAHALRIIEKVRRFIPDADKSTWRIRITLLTGGDDSNLSRSWGRAAKALRQEIRAVSCAKHGRGTERSTCLRAQKWVSGEPYSQEAVYRYSLASARPCA